MTLAAATFSTLPIEQLESIQPQFCADFSQLMVYPEVNLAFLDGEPMSLHDLEEVYLSLIAACTAVHTQTPQKRSWDTPIGVIEVEPRSFNVLINGVEHTPDTVDGYAQGLRSAVTMGPNARIDALGSLQ
ncbi:hypothetical protein [Corynebacterium sp. A21]|uniref:hypothetical protein n=1 Tax=Corynebacterium sp. A21 TaxID=3457318 RepID=UPI003FD22C74